MNRFYRHFFNSLPILLLLLSFGNAISQTKTGKSLARWWSDAAESSLQQSGANRQELEKALNMANVNQRDGIQFLIENMPQQDLKSLSADFLLDHLTMAYKGLQESPWAAKIPNELFLNDVLPYASVTEPRENWRRHLYEICLPLVKECKTPSQACKVLNEKLFSLYKVKYSTKRPSHASSAATENFLSRPPTISRKSTDFR